MTVFIRHRQTEEIGFKNHWRQNIFPAIFAENIMLP